jgi:hypothetical protein
VEEIVGVVAFGLGASLGMGAVRAAGRGFRPALKEVVKAGVTVTDAVASVTAEARESLSDLKAEAMAERAGKRPPARRSAAPRRIAVAREDKGEHETPR